MDQCSIGTTSHRPSASPHQPAGARSRAGPQRSDLGRVVLTHRRLGHPILLQTRSGAAPLGGGRGCGSRRGAGGRASRSTSWLLRAVVGRLTGRTVRGWRGAQSPRHVPRFPMPGQRPVGVPPTPAWRTRKALVSELARASPRGVSDGARTRDTQDHNLVLYQLSYTHHVSRPDARAGREPRQRYRRRSDARRARGSDPAHAVPATSSCGFASPAASSAAKEPTTSSAACFARSPLGPGAGTNSVFR
jgi:hypothetical protein